MRRLVHQPLRPPHATECGRDAVGCRQDLDLDIGVTVLLDSRAVDALSGDRRRPRPRLATPADDALPLTPPAARWCRNMAAFTAGSSPASWASIDECCVICGDT